MRLKTLFITLLSVLALTLSGCAETQLASHVVKQLPNANQSQGNFKVGNPYKVKGKTYTPRETYNFTQTGIASWYGPQFHGKKTANGEVFDMNEITAAHKTLQLPSLVRVTNLENGRSLIVRVNDRGPFKQGRVIDMSKRGAELLGFKNQGTAKVKLQVLSEESMKIAEAARRGEDTRGVEVTMNEEGRAARPPRDTITTPPTYQQASVVTQPVETEPLAAPDIPGHINNGKFLPDPVVKQLPVSPTNMYVQAGSFGDQANAVRLAKNLQSFGNAQVYPVDVNGSRFYRVRLGPMDQVNQADRVLASMSRAGHTQAIIVVE